MADQGGEKERGERRHWLVRSTSHHVLGPFTSQEIEKEIRAGTLSLRDEICPSGGKWVELFRAEPFLKVVK
ncbi:MAG: hypothetical protein HY391_04105, partial [Deltaproteobacteria bacterium]|nr:hypothetical protein [Deltaproteobacteria bacterium]